MRVGFMGLNCFRLPCVVLPLFLLYPVFLYSLARYLSIRGYRAALKSLERRFNGKAARFFLSCSFNGECKGLDFTIKPIPAGKNTPAYLQFSLKKDSNLKLKIYKESFLSRLGQRIGIIHEVKTQDELFDANFLIFANDPDQARSYLASVSKKNAITGLFGRGFDPLLIDGKKVSVKKAYLHRLDLLGDLEQPKVQETLDILFQLIVGL